VAVPFEHVHSGGGHIHPKRQAGCCAPRRQCQPISSHQHHTPGSTRASLKRLPVILDAARAVRYARHHARRGSQSAEGARILLCATLPGM
jgi:hypothetical protein